MTATTSNCRALAALATAAALLVAAAACGRRPEANDVPGSPRSAGASAAAAFPRILSARLIDSVVYHNELVDTAYLRRVEVRGDGFVDTLPGVLTTTEPFVAGDSVVYGLLFDQQEARAAFAYDARRRRVERLHFPREILLTSQPVFAPDAAHVAYLTPDGGGGTAHAEVLTWPGRRLVVRGPSVRVLETDAGVDDIAWDGPRRVVVGIALSYAGGSSPPWLRLRADLATGVTLVDTIVMPRADRGGAPPR